MSRLSVVFLLVASLFAATSALADAPSTMSYQGVLTDDGGTPVPDGNYSLTFRLYDVSVGGAALHTENFPVVAVEGGGFSVLLGSITALPVIFDRQIYLGVQIGADPELTPRVPLASSPYAMALRFPVVQSQALGSSLFDIGNTVGLTATLQGHSRIGSENTTGQLDLVRLGSVTPVSQWYSNANGASFELFDEAFNPTFTLAADATGTGGMLFVRRTIGASGFIVDGNYQGTNDPQVTIQGASRTASFNMSLVGNQSVILPTDAISAAETLDEAGVASINSTNTTAMDGTVQTMTSRTITVPANGYCLVIGTAEIQVIHNNGLATTGLFGVSDAAGSIPTTQDVQLTMPAAAATGTYFVPVTVHGLFQVIAGANTFYLLGDENSGSLQFTDLQLSIVYVPTAYGTVTPSLTAGTDDVAVGMGAPVSAAAEAREAEAFHRARVEREMAAMQAQVAELQQRLEQVVAEQAVAARRKEK